jgi:glycosyltransferase involved in cell wall biosynthesis
VGRGATTHSEWVEHLSWLLNNPESARIMGNTGRKIIEENYSLRALTPKIASILWSVSGK